MEKEVLRKFKKEMYKNILEHLSDEQEKILTDYPMPDCVDIAWEVYQPLINTFRKMLNTFK